MVWLLIAAAMSHPTAAALEQKLASAHSIHGIQQVLSDEGLELGDWEVARRLLAEGAVPRFATLSASAQDQIAQVLVLAERDPLISQALANPADAYAQFPDFLAVHGLNLEAEALEALSRPMDLDDQQLELVVGGIDPVTATLITTGITALAGLLTLWITKHYDTKIKIAEINAAKTA
jgi:hypothetical protein